MATGADPGIFEQLLDKAKGYGSSFQSGVQQAMAPGPLPAGVQRAGGFSGGAGNLTGRMLTGLANPVNAALVGGGTALAGGLMEGQELPELIGSTAGGTTASAIAAKLTPGLLARGPAGWLAAAGLNVAAPVVGGVIGQKTVGGIANALSPAANAATNAAGSAVNNAINPSSPSNVAGNSIEQNLEIAKTIQNSLGDVAAQNYLLQTGMMDKLGDLDQRRAVTAMRVSPVRTSARLAEIGAQGAYNLYNTGAQGINQALSNITANNPYAQMLS